LDGGIDPRPVFEIMLNHSRLKQDRDQRVADGLPTMTSAQWFHLKQTDIPFTRQKSGAAQSSGAAQPSRPTAVATLPNPDRIR
jgi:hypothetical protein